MFSMQVKDEVLDLFDLAQRQELADLVEQEARLSERRVQLPHWMWQQEEDAFRQRVQELLAEVCQPIR